MHGQSSYGKVIDGETKEGIPFVKILSQSQSSINLSDPQGYFVLNSSGCFEFKHPLYQSTTLTFETNDSILVILQRKTPIVNSAEQVLEGERIINNYHKYLPETKTTKFPEFDFLTYSTIKITEQSPNNPADWELLSQLESIEKNRFKYPDKKYSRVVKSRYHDGDSSTVGLIPINTYSISDENEYIDAVNLKYYNPLFNGAEKRYEYALKDSFLVSEGMVYAIYFRPKENKKFVALSGMLYFINDRSELWGGYLYQDKEYVHGFHFSIYLAETSRKTRFLKDLYIVLRLKNIPNYRRNSRLYYLAKYSSPSFDVKNTSDKKWIDMALFNNEKDTAQDGTWMMHQIVDKDKLEFIKKDTIEKKFVLSNSLKWMYNIYDGKLGYRLKYFDLNNVFAINRFESVRLGIGLQSHENLSDVFTFGGYFGYGLGDGNFKYGGNVGVFLGHARNHLISVHYTRDLLEPGLVNYLDKRQDLVRNFFTSRMDEYISTKVSLRTNINSYFTSSILFNNYSLHPLYDYIYNPGLVELSDTQTFRFTETSLLFNIGTPFSDNLDLRNIIYRKKKIRGNLFLNVTKGWKTEIGGDYDYWKLNGRLSTNFRFGRKSTLDVNLDGGIMSKDMPYQINYVGPGTEFKLTGIIIKNAFQSMKLYGFFADRYLHSFMDYNLDKMFRNQSKFNPELAFSLNLGWGKITGRKEIHENIEVRDYSEGYYEAGVLLNNLLRLKIYRYFYGGLGVGTFYGFGPDAEGGAFAFRISYELGVL